MGEWDQYAAFAHIESRIFYDLPGFFFFIFLGVGRVAVR